MPWRKIADMPKVFGEALEEEVVGTVTALSQQDQDFIF